MSLPQDQEPPSVAGLSLEDLPSDGPGVKTKHQRGKPSINVHLAQGLVEHEELPVVERGQDPQTQVVALVADDEAENPKAGAKTAAISSSSSFSSSGPAAVLVSREKDTKTKGGDRASASASPAAPAPAPEKPKRDTTTGRILSENGKTCLRCARKGLKCTLHFYGLDAEPRCAACRRSGAAHCVRPRNLRDQVPWHRGLPAWQNPNYVTGCVPPLPAAQMQAILREQLGEDEEDGEHAYLQGSYVGAADRAAMALPPFEWVEEEEEEQERPGGWRGSRRVVDWRAVVPTAMNRSLAPRRATVVPARGVVDPGTRRPSTAKPPLGTARSTSSGGVGPESTAAATVPGDSSDNSNKMKTALQQAGELDEAQLKYLRASRRYPPRAAHVTEAFPDAWF